MSHFLATWSQSIGLQGCTVLLNFFSRSNIGIAPQTTVVGVVCYRWGCSSSSVVCYHFTTNECILVARFGTLDTSYCSLRSADILWFSYLSSVWLSAVVLPSRVWQLPCRIFIIPTEAFLAVSLQQRKGKNGSGNFVFIRPRKLILSCAVHRRVMSGILIGMLKICSNHPRLGPIIVVSRIGAGWGTDRYCLRIRTCPSHAVVIMLTFTHCPAWWPIWVDANFLAL